MPAGLIVWNDEGQPQIINHNGFHFVAHSKGTVASNGVNYNGATGFVSLPQQNNPYLVFVRCGQGAANAFGSLNGFSWTVGQGTPSFDWWAYNLTFDSGNVGFKVWNEDGSLQFDCSQRPLSMPLVLDKNGKAAPNILVNTVDNMVQGPNWSGLQSNMAFLFSNLGQMIDVYTYSGPGSNIRGNMKFYPGVNTPDANSLNVNYMRRRPNITNPSNDTQHSGYVRSLPSYIVAATTW